jgi:hemolysin-activating ACP:hemolysin acyltransferase
MLAHAVCRKMRRIFSIMQNFEELKMATKTTANGKGPEKAAEAHKAGEHSAAHNGATANAAAPNGAATTERALDPAAVAQIAAFRARLQANVGEVVLAMANLPRYRNQSLADVLHLVIEPMLRDRIAIAKSAPEGKPEETAGIAIWANASDEADKRIREQIQARVFPIRLKAEDWNSGDNHWLLDVIAPTQKAATAVLANFKQVVKDKPIRIHPLVTQLVDPTVLEKMRVKPPEEKREQTT